MVCPSTGVAGWGVSGEQTDRSREQLNFLYWHESRGKSWLISSTKLIYTGGGSEDNLQMKNTEIQESCQCMQWWFYENQSSAKAEIGKEIKGQLEEFIPLHEKLNTEKYRPPSELVTVHTGMTEITWCQQGLPGLRVYRKVSKKGGTANSGRGLSQELVRNLNPNKSMGLRMHLRLLQQPDDVTVRLLSVIFETLWKYSDWRMLRYRARFPKRKNSNNDLVNLILALG